MICLVTGGAGFIGSHLVDRLVNDGHTVRVIDNESAIANDTFYWNESAENLVADVLDYEATHHMYNDVDYIFHLAAQSRVQLSLNDPQGTIYNNVMTTSAVVRHAMRTGVKKILLASTSAIYGNTPPPFTEDGDVAPLNAYSSSKLISENIINSYSNRIDTVCTRFFNVYGDREPTSKKYSTVIGIFLNQKNNGHPLTVTGDGDQTRDFIHVSDIVNAMILLMNANNTSGNTYNIGTGSSTKIIDIAKLISDDISYIDLPDGEARYTMANIDKIYNHTGWTPQIKIEDWILKSIDNAHS